MEAILFIVTSTDAIGTSKRSTGYEFSEIADPYFEFIKQGCTVDFASILGGTPPADGYDPSDMISKDFKESNGFKRLNFSHKLNDVDIEAYDAIFFPGGLGPMADMVENPIVKNTIKKVYESGRLVAAVCHGPVALLNVQLSDGSNLIDGKRITSFTEVEEKEKNHSLGDVIPFMLDKALAEQGGKFSNEDPFKSHVVVDGNLITGQNPASARGVAVETLKLLVS